MIDLINFLLIILLLLNLQLLSSSSLKICIKTVAFQGFIIGLTAFLNNTMDFTYRDLFVDGITLIIKSIILPYLIFRCMINIEIKREVEPYISYMSSVIMGILFFVVGYIISAKTKLPSVPGIFLFYPVSVMTIFVGLLIVITRKKAISQVLGFLVFENGIYLFGELLPLKSSLIIKLGVLLDVFVFIFIIGITVFHIRSEFNHIDTDRLSHLTDLPGKVERNGQ